MKPWMKWLFRVIFTLGAILVVVGMWYSIYKTRSYYDVYKRFDWEIITEWFVGGMVITILGLIAVMTSAKKLMEVSPRRH